SLSDSLPISQQHCRSYRESQSFRGLEVDGDFEFSGLLYRNVAGLGALEYLIDKGCSTAEEIPHTLHVAQETTGLRKLRQGPKCRQPMRKGDGCNTTAIRKERTGQRKGQSIYALASVLGLQ